MELLSYSLFLTFLAAIFIIIFIKSIWRSYRLPPGPWPLPIVGNVLMIGDKPHRSLARLAKTYGPIMTVHLGQVTTVVISSPDMARKVLQTNDQDFCGRSVPDGVKALGHHENSTAFRPVDQQWKNHRRIYATELFASRKINDNRALREKKVEELIGFVSKRCERGEEVDIGEAAFGTILNLISTTLLSIDMVELSSESPQYFKELIWETMVEGGAANISDFFPIIAAADLQGRRRRMAVLNGRMHEIFEEIIVERLRVKAEAAGGGNATPSTNDFLDSLIDYHLKDGDAKIERCNMKALLLELFVAGSDTSSSTVEWAMTELLCNPAAMAKARSEITATIGAEKSVDEGDILRLPYLQAVVKETLRMHAPTPFLLPRMTETDVQVSGYHIPKGTRVLVNAWAIGRSGDVWTDPDAFRPERFIDGNNQDVDYKGTDFELIPFGAGRRICPGLPLAFKMVHLILASLLQSFEWELPKGMGPMDVDMTEKFGITVAKALPLRAVPTC